ncbi:hypothetical protein ACQ4PT_037589 [Festuca glaucescens]
MAPSKFHLALFLAIALIVAMLQPSAAGRAEPPTSSTSSLSGFWSLPCLPFIPRIFCTPATPPPPSKPQPKECLPSLMGLMPCKDFLTNSTAPAPPNPGKCCDGLRSLFDDAPVCLCRISNDGDLDNLMSATIDRGNFLGLLTICNSGPSEYESCEGPVPPLRAAPTPEAAP